ncbi:hypothetical protein, partial [Pseudomonas sp. FW305-53]
KILNDEKIEETLPNNYLIKKESIETDWNLVRAGSPVSSFWRPAGHSHVFCNGVVIPTISSPRITLDGAILEHHSNPYEILYIDNDAALPLNLQRTGFLGDELHVIKEISLDMIKNHICNSICELKEYFERNRKLDKKAIRSSRNFSLRDSFYLFKSNTATPLFKGFDLSKCGYTIVDFTKHSLQRGLFYKSPQIISEENYGYVSVYEMDKLGDSVRGAINLLNVARLGTHYIRAKSLAPAEGKKCTGWIFVSKYDFAKLTDNEIKEVTENLTIKHVGSDWVSVTNSYQEEIPDDILCLLESGEDLNCFMFGLLRLPDLTGSESLFYEVWKDLELPNTLTPDNILEIQI